mmetsp:Transcript_6030/g.23937  ORF Transcript_6030/g.23937 Transcript_6030/m.23937 type:complete len:211 (+) Transcript_6030:411-1043(+)
MRARRSVNSATAVAPVLISMGKQSGVSIDAVILETRRDETRRSMRRDGSRSRHSSTRARRECVIARDITRRLARRRARARRRRTARRRSRWSARRRVRTASARRARSARRGSRSMRLASTTRRRCARRRRRSRAFDRCRRCSWGERYTAAPTIRARGSKAAISWPRRGRRGREGWTARRGRFARRARRSRTGRWRRRKRRRWRRRRRRRG